jgi:cell volume regulation protein A
VLGLFLIFVARPLAVWLCLLPFNMPRQETAFISWVGLRGAVSILLAITPILGGLENGRDIFNIAFIVVLVSLVIQGWTVGPLARRLGLIVPARLGPLEKVELELPGSAHHELLAYTIVPGSPVARGQRIPRWARPSLVVREGRSIKFQDAGRLTEGDHVYIFVPDRYPRLLDRLFASRTEVDPEDAEFFGAFALDPARPAADLEAAYGPGLTEAETAMTIGGLILARLGGRAEYADRVTIGPIELIVREVDEKGRIISVGVSLEPAPPAPPIPAFLSASEIGNRVRRLFGRLKKRGVASAPAADAGTPDSYNSRGH